MIRLARATLWVAIVVFGLVGALGVVLGAFEWWLVPVDLSGLDAAEAATFAGQQHFLKGLELGVAGLIWAVLPRVFSDRRIGWAVVGLMVVTPLARLIGWAQVGAPDWTFQLLVCFEILGALLVTAGVAQASRRAQVAGLRPT